MNNHITLVCGGRDFSDQKRLFNFLDKKFEYPPHDFHMILHGGAKGADTLAGVWARLRGVPEIIIPAQWNFFGKSAGPLRNEWMTYLEPAEIIAFPGGTGTNNMIELGRKKGIEVILA